MDNLEKIREMIRCIGVEKDNENFLYGLLRAFDFPEATISRVKLLKDPQNLSKSILIQNKLFFLPTAKANIYTEFENLKLKGISNIKARFFLIVNDDFVYAYDKITKDSISPSKKELYNYFDFFLPLVGIEKINTDINKTADLKAAEKFAELYNILIELNNTKNENILHGVNTMMARLLFCFYADSIGLIEKDTIHNIIATYTNKNSENLKAIFERLFLILIGKDRDDLPNYFNKLPIIKISLFKENVLIPNFNSKAKKLLLEISSLNWSSLNPDILGSLIQSIVIPENSSGLSNHYTSIPNIMKVLGPLFLDEFYEVFEKNKIDVSALKDLLSRIKKIAVFDPTCGAGNFLIVAFKELIKIEDIIKVAIFELTSEIYSEESNISISQFYGIDANHFKSEITKIGLWVASVQSKRISDQQTYCLDTFDSSNILLANPTRVSWNEFCSSKSEVYIVCNPTYKGSRKQSKEQKEDVAFVFSQYSGTKNLDYASCWLYLASKFIEKNNSRAAIVVTNSVTQGEQVGLLWPKIYKHNIGIFFAHTSFKWKNSSKGNTGVTVVVIGLSKLSDSMKKKIYTQATVYEAPNITPYLTSGDNVIVSKRTIPLSDLPLMPKGNMPYDGGNLILSELEMLNLTKDYPKSKVFIKKLFGSKEFIQDIKRFCLWIDDEKLNEALLIPPIKDRIELVKNNRLNSSDSAANKLASRPHQFREINTTSTQSIIIPSVSSERRRYIPIGFVGKEIIISNLAFAIYDCEPWIFGVLTSRMHLVWIKSVCGSLETRIRYSSRLGYNTFPFPSISPIQKKIILDSVLGVIDARQQTSEKSLAQMYDTDLMSKELLNAHQVLDAVIESCYRSEPFISDYQRLDYLFIEYKKKSETKQ